MERLQRLEGVNISKGQVRGECMEQSHVAVENIRECQRMLRMKFYVTLLKLLCSLLGQFDKMVGLGWTHRLHGMSLLTVAVSYFLLPDS